MEVQAAPKKEGGEAMSLAEKIYAANAFNFAEGGGSLNDLALFAFSAEAQFKHAVSLVNCDHCGSGYGMFECREPKSFCDPTWLCRDCNLVTTWRLKR